MKRRILSALYRADDFISGQELCEELHVSRTAVWKTINQLKEDGYEIQAVSRKGYKILSSPDQITGEEVGARLRTKRLGGEIHYYESIDSTIMRQSGWQSRERLTVPLFWLKSRRKEREEGEESGILPEGAA